MIFSFGITLTDREPMAVVLGCYWMFLALCMHFAKLCAFTWTILVKILRLLGFAIAEYVQD